jgi:glutathione peroxidase
MKHLKLTAALAATFSLGAFLLGGPPPAHDVEKDPTAAPAASKDNNPVSPLDFTVKTIDGKDKNLADYKGNVVMIVNVASRCGFTPQYKALEALHEKYGDKGLVIIGFPANDFHKQEPGTDEEIKEFCSSKYNVKFPMMSKISVKGDEKAPLYQFLTSDKTNGDFAGEIGWNFTKFVIDRNGNVIARYSSQTKPDAAKVTDEIEKALVAKAAEPKGDSK